MTVDVPTPSSDDEQRIEAALKSLLAEECFPDFAYDPKNASPELLARIHSHNCAAMKRAFVAAGVGALRAEVASLRTELAAEKRNTADTEGRYLGAVEDVRAAEGVLAQIRKAADEHAAELDSVHARGGTTIGREHFFVAKIAQLAVLDAGTPSETARIDQPSSRCGIYDAHKPDMWTEGHVHFARCTICQETFTHSSSSGALEILLAHWARTPTPPEEQTR